MSERIDRLLDHMLASARADDALFEHRGTTYKRTADGIDLGTTSSTLDEGRARLREVLVQLDGEGAWQRSGALGSLEARWVPPPSGIWRTERDEILARDGEDYVLIDTNGAIVRRFEEIGTYPYAYVPIDDESGTYYSVDSKNRTFIQHDWEVSDIGIGSGTDEVVLANLLADHDPETARFVAVVLGHSQST